MPLSYYCLLAVCVCFSGHVRRDLNPQPAVLETAALPLSYTRKPGAGGGARTPSLVFGRDTRCRLRYSRMVPAHGEQVLKLPLLLVLLCG